MLTRIIVLIANGMLKRTREYFVLGLFIVMLYIESNFQGTGRQL